MKWGSGWTRRPSPPEPAPPPAALYPGSFPTGGQRRGGPVHRSATAKHSSKSFSCRANNMDNPSVCGRVWLLPASTAHGRRCSGPARDPHGRLARPAWHAPPRPWDGGQSTSHWKSSRCKCFFFFFSFLKKRSQVTFKWKCNFLTATGCARPHPCDAQAPEGKVLEPQSPISACSVCRAPLGPAEGPE